MMMTVEDVSYGRVWKTLTKLAFEPATEIGVDRIGEDDPAGSDQKDRVVVVVLNAIEVAGDSADAAPRWTLRLLGMCSHYGEKKDGKKPCCHGVTSQCQCGA